jgi:hypothetical protein
MGQKEMVWGMTDMNENNYSMAGWLAIAGAIIFPVIFIVGIAQDIIGQQVFGYQGPKLGPGDLLSLVFTGIAVYVIIMFRRLLHERYQFHDLDVLITIVIIWNILFQVVGLLLKAIVLIAWPISEVVMIVMFLSFFAVGMISAGIIDIVFAVKLFRKIDIFSGPIKALAYLTMVSGILTVTVILTPLALLLAPVSMVLYGVIFLRSPEDVEFV